MDLNKIWAQDSTLFNVGSEFAFCLRTVSTLSVGFRVYIPSKNYLHTLSLRFRVCILFENCLNSSGCVRVLILSENHLLTLHARFGV